MDVGSNKKRLKISWAVNKDTKQRSVIVSHVGNHYVIRAASWNTTIAAGDSVDFGFIATLFSADPDWLSGLEQRLAASADDEFLTRIPALRGGFQSLSAADRTRLLRDRLAVLQQPGGPAATGARHIEDPEMLAHATAADRAGRAAVAELLPDFTIYEPGTVDAFAKPVSISEPPGEITLADRWRLVLGVKGCNSAKGRCAASSLDQLYGAQVLSCFGMFDHAGGCPLKDDFKPLCQNNGIPPIRVLCCLLTDAQPAGIWCLSRGSSAALSVLNCFYS